MLFEEVVRQLAGGANQHEPLFFKHKFSMEDDDMWYPLEWSKRMSDLSIIGELMKDGVGNIWRKSAPILPSVVSEHLLRDVSRLPHRRCGRFRDEMERSHVMVATSSSSSAYQE